MSTVNKFSKDAFVFLLSTELQYCYKAQGRNVTSNKSRSYYRMALDYGKLSSAEDIEYKNAASAIADAVFDLMGTRYPLDNPDISFVYPFYKSASETDSSDIAMCIDGNRVMGIKIDSCPHARIPTPALFNSNSESCEIVDIGKDWFGNGCSSLTYINELASYNEVLHEYVGRTWDDAFPDLSERYRKMYDPVLNALIDEIRRQCEITGAAGRLIKTFFGPHDYYLITLNSGAKLAKVGAYELNGQLGNGAAYTDRLLDARLVSVGFKERANSIANAKIALVFDNGWAINIRLRRAGNEIKSTSFRLEADFKGTAPHDLKQIEVRWK